MMKWRELRMTIVSRQAFFSHEASGCTTAPRPVAKIVIGKDAVPRIPSATKPRYSPSATSTVSPGAVAKAIALCISRQGARSVQSLISRPRGETANVRPLRLGSLRNNAGPPVPPARMRCSNTPTFPSGSDDAANRAQEIRPNTVPMRYGRNVIASPFNEIRAGCSESTAHAQVIPRALVSRAIDRVVRRAGRTRTSAEDTNFVNGQACFTAPHAPRTKPADERNRAEG